VVHEQVTVTVLPQGSMDDSTSTGGSDNNSTTGSDDNASTGSDDNSTGGSDSNGSTEGGSPTAAIKSLTLAIAKTTLNKDHNTTINIKATYDDNTTKTPSNIEWLITPKDAVNIKGNSLTALKDTNVTIQAKAGNTLSNKVKLNIYWEVDGYRLPPKPDPKVNNATLLGVDVNHNGARDDVERKVYAAYKKAIDRAVMMQAFKTEQAMLADPDLVKNAREWEKKTWKAINCNDYLSTYKQVAPMSRQDIERTTSWLINTEKRIRKYYQYDRALSGGVYSVGDGTLQDCEFDVEKVLEMDR